VLLRQQYLDTVGVFDERLFLYYEDTDLSWRGRLQGWRYVYEPTAVVRHRHAQSSGVGSPVFRFHTERNRLLVLAKCAPARLAWRAGLGEAKRTLIANLRGLVWRPLTLRMPDRPEAAHRRRVFGSYLSLLPGVLRDRWMMNRRVSRRSLMTWETAK
jgi:GT2 family glycosyltransferase